ncbi:MAG: tRNA pseudouridine(55) synthase TruB [Pseudomonadota bacterium]
MKPQRSLTGVLIVNKPSGPTSNRVLQRVRQLFNFKKVGHTGCLDPLASGVLPVCFGGATRLAEFMLADNKVYEADICLGITTTTGDAMGEIVAEQTPPDISDEFLQDILASFVGTSDQQAHKYSALKYQGKPLYAYAREGIEVPAKHRQITISSIQWLSRLSNNGFKIQVSCSKGTYIRSLAEDIGTKIGCGAHLIGLKRIQSGIFHINQALNLDVLENLSVAEREQFLLPAWDAVPHLKKYAMPDALAHELLIGRAVESSSIDSNYPTEHIVLITEAQQFLGLGRIESGKIFPWRMMPKEKIFESLP